MGASTARKASFTALTLILTPLAGWADNARDWQNTPTDLNMLLGYYNRVDSNTPIDTALPIKGLSLNAESRFCITHALLSGCRACHPEL